MEVYMPRKRKEFKMISVCEKCGKLQKPDLEKSNKNWIVYSCNEVCECGGKFVMKFDE